MKMVEEDMKAGRKVKVEVGSGYVDLEKEEIKHIFNRYFELQGIDAHLELVNRQSLDANIIPNKRTAENVEELKCLDKFIRYCNRNIKEGTYWDIKINIEDFCDSGFVYSNSERHDDICSDEKDYDCFAKARIESNEDELSKYSFEDILDKKIEECPGSNTRACKHILNQEGVKAYLLR